MSISILRRGITAVLLLSAAQVAAQDISTVAGTGSSGFSGDGSAATSALLNYAQDVALDTFGNVYIADAANQRIRKITAATGIITTVAGNGSAGYSGDGGAATLARLSAPIGVATDLGGNVYICDNGNHCIRKLTVATGIITTVAGDGISGASGDGGAATAARLYAPYDMTVDADNNIYIADVSNNKIRKVTAATGIISTVAGTGAAGFSGDGAAATSARLYQPFGVAVDASGNLYIADAANFRVRKVTAATGNISTIAGTGTSGYSGDGGAATAARLNTPYSITVNKSGDVYISDFRNHRVRKINAATNAISTVAGTGTIGYSGDGGLATSARMGEPRGLFCDRYDNLYLADYLNSAIRFICFAGTTPGAPLVTSPLTLCTGSTSAPLSAIGTNLRWYYNPVGGTAITTAPVPATTTTGSITYYVSQSTSCGESPRAALVVNVINSPAAPVVSSPLTYCSGKPATALTATGSSLNWYNSATGGTGSSVAPVPSTTSAGSTNFYVSQGGAGCESPRALITVQVNPTPDTPVASSAVYYCIGATATALSATGSNLKWYDVATGGTASATAPVPVTSVAGIKTYYVSQSAASGCESNRKAISVQTSPRPDVNITGKTAPLFYYCKGSVLTLKSVVTPAALLYRWQLEGTDIPGAGGTSYDAAVSGRYSVIVSNGPDCNDTATVVVVQDSSFLLTTLFPRDINICDGVTVKLYASPAAGDSLRYEWMKDGVVLPGDTIAELEVGIAGNYTVRITNKAGCSFSPEPSLVSTYTPVPKPMIDRSGSLLSIPAGYGSYQWFRNDKAVSAADARSLPLFFDGVYFVKVTDENGCINYSDTIIISALGLPDPKTGNGIVLYPVPATNEIQVSGIASADIRAYDLSGKTIGLFRYTRSVDISGWPDGTYFLALSSPDGTLLTLRKVQKISK